MKRNLRKAFAFILALTMVVSLFACGKKDANPDGGDSSSDDNGGRLFIDLQFT